MQIILTCKSAMHCINTSRISVPSVLQHLALQSSVHYPESDALLSGVKKFSAAPDVRAVGPEGNDGQGSGGSGISHGTFHTKADFYGILSLSAFKTQPRISSFSSPILTMPI